MYTHTCTPNPTSQKMENKISKNHQIGRSKSDVLLCKNHPKHRQSPGVCSVCLRERLCQLSSSSSCSNTTTMAFSCSSSLSSHYSSSESTPPVHHLYPLASEAKGSMTMSLLRSVKNVLTKSKSMAYVVRVKEGEVRDGKKKGGFWKKLLRSRSKKIDEGLVDSRIMRDRVIRIKKVH